MPEPAVATLVSITERAVDDNGNGRPDRLEIIATLNVVKPGEYEIRFALEDAGGALVMGLGDATLPAGSQKKLTASVPAKRLWAVLKDGPFTIRYLQMHLREGNGFGPLVRGEVGPVKTAAYRRDGWDRGSVYGEETVRLRPIRRGKTGKFRALEVVWEAVTEGGRCGWSGDLSVGNAEARLLQGGEIQPGRSRFVFEFDAGAWAKETSSESSFMGTVNCEDSTAEAPSAFVPLRVQPEAFEAWDTPLPVISQFMMRATVGKDFGWAVADLEVRGRAAGPVQYRLKSVPSGLRATVSGATLEVAAGAQMVPGRYYVDVEAVSGNLRGTGTVVVDVVTAVPPKAEGKHASGAATARGVRPNAQGRFQTLEVLWPVDVPGRNCNWDGQIAGEGAQTSTIAEHAWLPAGQSTLSLVFPGSVVGNSGTVNWVFRGHIACGSTGQEQGVTRETKLTLQPATFAKRVGLAVWSGMIARVGSGQFAMAELTVNSSATEEATFQVMRVPKGLVIKPVRTSRFRDSHSMTMEVWADEQVVDGRYYLPVTVTVGKQTGTAEVVVDVARE